MNSKTTGAWFGIAVVLFALVFFFERHWNAAPAGPAKILAGLQPATVTSVQVIPAGALEIRADRRR
jgi:hypothetical protein